MSTQSEYEAAFAGARRILEQVRDATPDPAARSAAVAFAMNRLRPGLGARVAQRVVVLARLLGSLDAALEAAVAEAIIATAIKGEGLSGFGEAGGTGTGTGSRGPITGDKTAGGSAAPSTPRGGGMTTTQTIGLVTDGVGAAARIGMDIYGAVTEARRQEALLAAQLEQIRAGAPTAENLAQQQALQNQITQLQQQITVGQQQIASGSSGAAGISPTLLYAGIGVGVLLIGGIAIFALTGKK